MAVHTEWVSHESKNELTHCDIDLWDEENARAVISLVTNKVAEQMADARMAKPELFLMEERTLRKEVNPTPTDNRLRLSFWNEYEKAQSNMKRMEMKSVYAGVCSPQYFHDTYLRRPEHVAWLLCPPASYMVIMEEALMFGIDQLRDILDLPVVKEVNGRKVVDTKLGELKAKIVALLDMRVKGAIIQKNLNLNLSTTTDVKGMTQDQSMAAIDQRLKELESQSQNSQALVELSSRPLHGTVEVLPPE